MITEYYFSHAWSWRLL